MITSKFLASYYFQDITTPWYDSCAATSLSLPSSRWCYRPSQQCIILSDRCWGHGQIECPVSCQSFWSCPLWCYCDPISMHARAWYLPTHCQHPNDHHSLFILSIYYCSTPLLWSFKCVGVTTTRKYSFLYSLWEQQNNAIVNCCCRVLVSHVEVCSPHSKMRCSVLYYLLLAEH